MVDYGPFKPSTRVRFPPPVLVHFKRGTNDKGFGKAQAGTSQAKGSS